MTVKRMSQAERNRRSKQAEILITAAYTLRAFHRPELADEVDTLAQKVRDGEVSYDVSRVL